MDDEDDDSEKNTPNYKLHDKKKLYVRRSFRYRSTFSQSFRPVIFVMYFLRNVLHILHVGAVTEEYFKTINLNGRTLLILENRHAAAPFSF